MGMSEQPPRDPTDQEIDRIGTSCDLGSCDDESQMLIWDAWLECWLPSCAQCAALEQIRRSELWVASPQ